MLSFVPSMFADAAMGMRTKAVVATTLEDGRLQLRAGPVTSHLVGQAGGFVSHILERHGRRRCPACQHEEQHGAADDRTDCLSH